MIYLRYEETIKELAKAIVHPLHSPEFEKLRLPVDIQISDYRTVGVTGTRQSGKTESALRLASELPGRTLFLASGAMLCKDAKARFATMSPENRSVVFAYGPARNAVRLADRWDNVVVDDAGIYMHVWGHSKTFKALAGSCSENIIVYLFG